MGVGGGGGRVWVKEKGSEREGKKDKKEKNMQNHHESLKFTETGLHRRKC